MFRPAIYKSTAHLVQRMNMTLTLVGSIEAPSEWRLRPPTVGWLPLEQMHGNVSASNSVQFVEVPFVVDASGLAERPSEPYESFVYLDVTTFDRFLTTVTFTSRVLLTVTAELQMVVWGEVGYGIRCEVNQAPPIGIRIFESRPVIFTACDLVCGMYMCDMAMACCVIHALPVLVCGLSAQHTEELIMHAAFW